MNWQQLGLAWSSWIFRLKDPNVQTVLQWNIKGLRLQSSCCQNFQGSSSALRKQPHLARCIPAETHSMSLPVFRCRIACRPWLPAAVQSDDVVLLKTHIKWYWENRKFQQSNATHVAILRPLQMHTDRWDFTHNRSVWLFSHYICSVVLRVWCFGHFARADN